MEIILNAFWFVLALASFGLWWRCGLRCEAARATRLHGLTALCCILFILFPAISMTDDLHADLLVMEEASFSRRGLRGGGHASRLIASDLNTPAIACELAANLFAFRFIVVGHVLCADSHVHSVFLIAPSAGRAPPAQLQLS